MELTLRGELGREAGGRRGSFGHSLDTFTTVRPLLGLSKAREVSLFSVAQTLAPSRQYRRAQAQVVFRIGWSKNGFVIVHGRLLRQLCLAVPDGHGRGPTPASVNLALRR
jgi:hypothetical protein